MASAAFLIKKNLVISYTTELKKLIIKPTSAKKLAGKEKLVGIEILADTKKLIVIRHNYKN